MREVRLFNHNDIDMFDHYAKTFESNFADHQYYPSFSNLKKYLIEKNPNIAIGAIIENSSIEGMLVGYTLDFSWPKQNIIPIFVLRGLRGLQTTSEDKDKLVRVVNGYFHNRKYYSFLLSFKFHHSFTYHNADQKLDKFFRRGFLSESYDYFLEDIIPSNACWEEIPIAYRYIIDKDCKETETRVIVRGILKYHLR